jgi:hypothetical protein
MKIKISKYVSPLIATLCFSIALPPASVYAGFLIPVESACVSCRTTCACRPTCKTSCKVKKPQRKKHVVRHHVIKRHCTYRAVSPCYFRPREYVEFRSGPYVPSCGGRWADLESDNYYFASDRSTGDDDPMVNPDMNIDY